jgi:Uma2 family endonuclease
VKEYWIVIPDEGSIEIFVLQDKTYVSHRTYGKDAILESPIISGLRIDLKNIF